MSDFPNDDLKTEPVSGLADLQQNSHTGNCGLNAPIRGAFQDRVMKYRNRLAKVLQDETTVTKDPMRIDDVVEAQVNQCDFSGT
jgi:hypothetical protein